MSAGGAQSPDPPDPPDPSDRTAIQDCMVDNFCWGCGADNPDGLHLKSYRDGDIVVAEWWPSPAHAAGPRHFVNGGIIATLLDCHGVSTAIADAYRREHRELGSDPEIWCATAAMTVEYLRPPRSTRRCRSLRGSWRSTGGTPRSSARSRPGRSSGRGLRCGRCAYRGSGVTARVLPACSHAIPTSSSLTAHSCRAAPSSRAASLGVAGAHLTQ